ncbi:hypothetical protein FRC00_004696 [Tulasnella sp. 408]|nr:hypothetical protein FRC00_004696 [Tulasnella sp. 408]
MINSDTTAHADPPRSSVYRLSYDDLYSIFTLCWNSGDDTFPVNASLVCRSWRWSILDMPAFWGRVRFYHKEPRLSMERYVTWMQRAKDAWLDILINEKPFSESAFENIEAIMELIGPQMQRWRSLRMDRVDAKSIPIFLDHLKDCSLPQLKSLKIVRLRRGYTGHTNLGRLELALHAPQLKEVELVGVEADFGSPLFHNLHALHLKDQKFGSFVSWEAKDFVHQLLRQSPHLKRLSVKEFGSFKGISPSQVLDIATRPLPPDDEEPFSHPFLLDLTLDFRDYVIEAMIPSIIFPALRKFLPAQKCRISLRSWHLPVLIRNSPFLSLKEITLTGNPSHDEHDHHLAEALTTLRSLTWLELQRFVISQVDDAILALGHLCPQLQTLQIVRCTQVDLSQVRAMIDMRLGAQGVNNLQTLVIEGGIDSASGRLKATKAWLEDRVERVILEADNGLV